MNFRAKNCKGAPTLIFIFGAKSDFQTFDLISGNLVDWWHPVTKEKYVKKAECIIKQYGNYSLPGLGLNLSGINTQGENIADNGGIKEAYRAYSKSD